ncbi:YabP/YqfC family sporulation protein [Desulfosporosinus sp. Sb-LF]|uniref:YabP/YqfC family sporulation protein n=1 Tax=Desulfosporosinus sp. Sb-LF TaxID=2560027 RepID=UPI00107F209C|nr:YabP/YqfC family sporulation protein [Desulfosporosinus sp. Sb-LF]TGE32546.1 sporulation protein [Desulfosporosinus sp. Sb-LF]
MFKKLKKNVGDVLDFPPDVVEDGPKITITGRQEILVENYISILVFSEEEIRLETTQGDICFRGRGLGLKVILSTELRIEGELSSFSFEGGEIK